MLGGSNRSGCDMASGDQGMTEPDYTQTAYETKLAELDRLLNDPDVKMEPARVWSLLAELAEPAARN